MDFSKKNKRPKLCNRVEPAPSATKNILTLRSKRRAESNAGSARTPPPADRKRTWVNSKDSDYVQRYLAAYIDLLELGSKIELIATFPLMRSISALYLYAARIRIKL